jgi:CheY-like chemotaxis protein
MGRSVAARGGVARPALLLVDDDDLFRGVIEDYLWDLGYDVHVAANGEDAVELIIADEVHPQLLLLDLCMPAMSGWDVLAVFDRSQRLVEVPCVVITGVANSGLEARPRTSVLRKPFAISDLRRELERWCPRI